MMVGHPVRVAAPQGELVSLGVLKDHLGVVGAHDDARIAALLAAAVAHLDGWRGALGRCILTQSWRVDYDDEGTHLLPFPDVSAVTAVDATGAAVTAVLSQGARGSYVTLEGPATVTLTAAIGADALPILRAAVCMLVGHWYEQRAAVIVGTANEMPLSFQALIGTLRWVRS